MKRSIFLIAVLGIVLAFALLFFIFPSLNIKPPAKIFHIGIIARGAAYESAIEGYKQEMTRLGYLEGKNVIYDIHFVATKEEVVAIVDSLTKKNFDLIHTYSTPVTTAAYKQTKKMLHPTPIVFGSMGDPQASGLIESMSHPGTNITGVSSRATELTAKRLELLAEVVPGLKQVAVPRAQASAGDASSIKSVEIAKTTAAQLGLNISELNTKNATDTQITAKQITRAKFQGILIPSDSLIWANIDVYIKQAISQKIPLATFDLDQVKKGALIGFGPDYHVSGQQAADITNKILNGKNPGDLPIEQPDRLLTIVNLDTAKAIGLTISDAFLRKSDVIIKDGKVNSN